MTPDRYRPVDTDEVLRRVDTHARVGAALLGGLGEVGREGDDEAFTSELVTAARNAAEHELADVAYDLARACLAAHEEYGRTQVWVEAPREVAELHSALVELHERAHEAKLIHSLPEPGAESDLRSVSTAIQLCERLEGSTDRVRFLQAQIPCIHERWDEVIHRSTDLANSASTAAWRRCALILKSYALVKNEDAEALHVIETIDREFGRDRVTLFNACCAHSYSGNLTGFRTAADQLASLGGDGLDTFDFASAVRAKTATFERELGISAADVLDSFGMEPQ